MGWSWRPRWTSEQQVSCTFLCSLGSVTLSVRAVPHTTRFVAAQRERLALTLSLASRRASERGGSLYFLSLLLLYCGRPVDEQERDRDRERGRKRDPPDRGARMQ